MSHLQGSTTQKELALTFDLSFEIIRQPQEKPKEVQHVSIRMKRGLSANRWDCALKLKVSG